MNTWVQEAGTLLLLGLVLHVLWKASPQHQKQIEAQSPPPPGPPPKPQPPPGWSVSPWEP
jgi:hypothetical protein